MRILVSTSSQPNMVLLIDIDTVFQLRPFISWSRASPRRHQIALAIEFKHRWRGAPDRSSFVRLQGGRPVGDPDVIALIHSDTGHCADDPMVWQRLWPRWIYAERRHLF